MNTCLSHNIIIIRQVAEMTQTEFAQLIGGSKGNKMKIYSYEKKGATPPLVVLQRIADIAGVSIDNLVNKKLKEADIKMHPEKIKKKLNLDAITNLTRAEITAHQALLTVVMLKLINVESVVLKKPFDELYADVQKKVQSEVKRLQGEHHIA